MNREPIASITPEFKADSHRSFAELRERGPVQRVRLANGLDAWAVLGYEQAREALVHPAIRKDMSPAQRALAAIGYSSHKVGEGAGGSLLFVDPPDHTRLRRLVAPVFSPRRIQTLSSQAQEVVDELLDAMTPLDEVDLVTAYTEPMPLTIICEMMGVPPAERIRFREWSKLVVGLPSEQQRKAGLSLNGYLADLVERKRAEPADDLFSDLIAAQSAQDGVLATTELIAMGFLFIVAGHDTTTNLLGNAIVALLREPEQADLLRARPELIGQAVEEFLRFDSSVEQATIRVAAENLDLAGVPIRRGDVVMVYLGPASRGAALSDGGDPDRLNVTRANARHIAFGHGIHHCLGAPLARLEARIAIGSLLERFPSLRPAIPLDDISWIPAGMMRGPLSLSVRLHA
jgi:cytochrome P450